MNESVNTVKDPVCGMVIDPRHAVASFLYKGKQYHFCSQMCKAMFEREPEKYTDNVEQKSA